MGDKNLVAKIHEYIVENKNSSMRVWVANDILNDSYVSSLGDHIGDIIYNGCVNEVYSLMSHSNTEKFFDDFSDECLEMLDRVVKKHGKFFYTINKNNVAWLCYEEITQEIAAHIGLEC